MVFPTLSQEKMPKKFGELRCQKKEQFKKKERKKIILRKALKSSNFGLHSLDEEAMTVRKRHQNADSAKQKSEDQKKEPTSDSTKDNEEEDTENKFPPMATKNTNHKSSEGLLISIRFEVYHNLKLFQETMTSLSIQDIANFPGYVMKVLTNREKHQSFPLRKSSLLCFYIIFALALFTRFYNISNPTHVW